MKSADDPKYNRFVDEYGWRPWVEVVAVVGMVLLCLAAMLGAAFVGLNHSTHVSCLRLSEQTGLPTKVARSGIDIECYILVPGLGFIPADRYRGVDLPAVGE